MKIRNFFGIRTLRASGRCVGGGKVEVFYIGKNFIPELIQKVFFKDELIGVCEKHVFIWELLCAWKKVIREPNLIIIQDYELLKIFLGKRSLIIPNFVRQVVDLRGNYKDIKDLFLKQRTSNDLRKINKYEFSYEYIKKGKVRFFYEKMHVPMIKIRHGKTGAIGTLKEFSKYCRDGILMIKKNDKYVAGASLIKKEDRLISRRFGVLNGSKLLYKQGVMAAIHFYLILYANDREYSFVDFGYSIPSLADGVFIYKSKWGAKIEIDDDVNTFVLRPKNVNENILSIFTKHPLIVIGKGRIGVCLVDGAEVRMSDKYRRMGVDYIKRLSL